MSKKWRLRRPFGKQHCKRTQALLKSVSEHFYHIHWSLESPLSWKNSLLLTCKILGLLVKILAAEKVYLVFNWDSLTIAIQMQLSQKQKSFSQFFAAFLKSRLIFKHLEKKMTLIAFVFRKFRNPKSWVDKCLKCPVGEDPSTSNMLNVLKHCWNLHHSTFIIFTDHHQVSWVGKCVSYWHAKSWYCLFIHWLRMKSILFLIEII